MDRKFLIIQTAFLGDVILTLPLVQVLKTHYPDSEIDFICIPETSLLLKNNNLINEIIPYDKKKSGITGLYELIKKIRTKKYDALISPHRSYRSAVISYLSDAKFKITFDKSSMSFLYDKIIKYEKGIHEIQRNLFLLTALDIHENRIIRPEIFLSDEEKRKIDCYFYEHKLNPEDKFIVIAPGTVWFTKRFPEEKFVQLCNLMTDLNIKIFLAGGRGDKPVSDFIVNNSRNKNLINITGNLSILESAELIRSSSLLITNDSAPMHIADSFETPVIAVFGATVPAFGFYPYNKKDTVIEINNLNCRPCSIHGGRKCPIGTFDCMNKIDEKLIFEKVCGILS